MRHGSGDGNAEHFSRQNGGGSGSASYVCGPGPVDGGIHIVGAPGPEVGHGPAPCGPDNPVGLGGDKGLMVYLQQKSGLYELCVHQRGHHGDNGFVGIHNGPLGHGVHVSPEPEMEQVVQKVLRKQVPGAQVLHIVRGKVQVLDVFHSLLQACKDGKACVVGIFSVKYVKGHQGLFGILVKIAVGHGEFIHVHDHGKVSFVKLRFHFHTLSFVIFRGQGLLLLFSAERSP